MVKKTGLFFFNRSLSVMLDHRKFRISLLFLNHKSNQHAVQQSSNSLTFCPTHYYVFNSSKNMVKSGKVKILE